MKLARGKKIVSSIGLTMATPTVMIMPDLDPKYPKTPLSNLTDG